MTPVTISQTGIGRSSVVVPDSFQNPFNVGMQIVVTGTPVFNIELTMQDMMMSSSGATWTPAGTEFTALTATTSLSLTVPCHGISINVTGGTGTVQASMVQAGIR